jgi:hypothetical protein
MERVPVGFREALCPGKPSLFISERPTNLSGSARRLDEAIPRLFPLPYYEAFYYSSDITRELRGKPIYVANEQGKLDRKWTPTDGLRTGMPRTGLDDGVVPALVGLKRLRRQTTLPMDSETTEPIKLGKQVWQRKIDSSFL